MVEITLKLPPKAKILVKEGEEVKIGDPIYKQIVKEEKVIPLSKKLKIKPDKIFKYLKHFVGDEIKKGELIADKKGFFRTKKITADSNGVIKEINHETGEIIFEKDVEDKNKIIYSQLKAKIKKIKNNEIIFVLKDAKIFPLKRAEKDIGGKLIAKEKVYFGEDLSEAQNNILVTETLNNYLFLKLEAIGAKGVIVINSLPENNDYNLVIAMPKKRDDFKKILSYNQSYCFINSQKNELYIYE